MNTNNDNDGAGVMGVVAGVLTLVTFFLATLAYLLWSSAYVGAQMWAWFLVPLGLPAITVAQAWGVAMLVTFWTYQHHVWKGKDERNSTERWTEIATVVLRPWAFLFFGWVCHHFFITK